MRLMDIDELWKDITSEIEDCSDVLEIIERHTVIDTSKEIFCSVNVDTDEVLERLKELGWKPVKHGRWISEDVIFGGVPFYCSECGFRKHVGDERRYNYCPNCGNPLDEVSDEDN